jgi:hypothetical protein
MYLIEGLKKISVDGKNNDLMKTSLPKYSKEPSSSYSAVESNNSGYVFDDLNDNPLFSDNIMLTDCSIDENLYDPKTVSIFNINTSSNKPSGLKNVSKYTSSNNSFLVENNAFSVKNDTNNDSAKTTDINIDSFTGFVN